MSYKALVLTVASLLALAFAPAPRGFAESAQPGFFKRLDDHTYVLSLRRGAKLIESLKAFQKATGVKSGSVSGVGAVQNTRLSQFRYEGESLVDGTKAAAPKWPGHDGILVAGRREIAGLSCILTTSKTDEKGAVGPSDPHCHIALAGSDEPAKDAKTGYPTVGGHVLESEVGVIVELVITVYPTELKKKYDPEFNGTVLDLDAANGGTEIRY